MLSGFFEFQVLGKSIELGWFIQQNWYFRVDLSSAFSLKVLLPNGGDCGETVLRKDLWEFAYQWDGLSESFDLYWSVFFEDEFGEEEAFVESAGSANSVDVVFVEFGLLGHVVN